MLFTCGQLYEMYADCYTDNLWCALLWSAALRRPAPGEQCQGNVSSDMSSLQAEFPYRECNYYNCVFLVRQAAS